MFQQTLLQPEWDKRWITQFALDDTETLDINPVNRFGLFQFACEDDAQTFGIVHFNVDSPFLVSVAIGSNVTTTLTTASNLNVGVSNDQIRVENLSGSQRTIRASIL